MKMKFLFIFLQFLAMHSQAGDLKFSALQAISPGTATRQSVTTALGKPQETKTFLDAGQSTELWIYVENNVDRITLSFTPNENVLHGWTWAVPDRSPEQDLKVALSRFNRASWDVETVKWINPHHFPNECYFRDRKLGVSIEFNKTRNTVASVTKWDPKRQPAASDNETPPKFCLDRKQEQCAEGIPSKEWLKKWKDHLCKIPK